MTDGRVESIDNPSRSLSIVRGWLSLNCQVKCLALFSDIHGTRINHNSPIVKGLRRAYRVFVNANLRYKCIAFSAYGLGPTLSVYLPRAQLVLRLIIADDI